MASNDDVFYECEDDEKPQTGHTLRSGATRKRSFQGMRNTLQESLKKSFKKPKLDAPIENKSNESTFKYGNYNRYYGYRNENKEVDKRLSVFKKEWFENKVCLDIGSNVGHVSLWIGKHFHPETIKGVDIDCELVKCARKNIVHYIDENCMSAVDTSIHNVDSNDCYSKTKDETEVVLPNLQAECEQSELENNESGHPGCKENIEPDERKDVKKADINKGSAFPYNVSFILENYVPASRGVLKHLKEEFHVILCLSVTKWVQLNFGDEGLRLMFQKIYRQLHPGGMLILEPQPYKSYKRRKNITAAIRRNYDAMKFMPDQFIDYLLSSEIGFLKCEQIEVTKHEKEGFQRPIYILMK